MLLPNASVDMSKWAVIACDQYTSNKAYWDKVEELVGDAPSTLKITFPEYYLGKIDEAKKIVANGVKYYFEGANMPATNEAIAYLQANGVIVGPAKAVNAGGVAVSALEMSQNSERLSWTREEVDAKLKGIMKSIHDNSAKAAEEYGLGYDLVKGANIAGFLKVAEAMMAQGLF